MDGLKKDQRSTCKRLHGQHNTETNCSVDIEGLCIQCSLAPCCAWWQSVSSFTISSSSSFIVLSSFSYFSYLTVMILLQMQIVMVILVLLMAWESSRGPRYCLLTASTIPTLCLNRVSSVPVTVLGHRSSSSYLFLIIWIIWNVMTRSNWDISGYDATIPMFCWNQHQCKNGSVTVLGTLTLKHWECGWVGHHVRRFRLLTKSFSKAGIGIKLHISYFLICLWCFQDT